MEDERLDGVSKCQDEETTLGDYRQRELTVITAEGQEAMVAWKEVKMLLEGGASCCMEVDKVDWQVKRGG